MKVHVWRRECAWERKSRKRRLPGGENELAWRSPVMTMRNARLGRGRSKLAAESERPDGREKVWIEVMKALRSASGALTLPVPWLVATQARGLLLRRRSAPKAAPQGPPPLILASPPQSPTLCLSSAAQSPSLTSKEPRPLAEQHPPAASARAPPPSDSSGPASELPS